MFGMGHEGTTNLITRALAAVGKSLETVPDPTQIHYHLPRSKAHPQVIPNVLHFATSMQAEQGTVLDSSPSMRYPRTLLPHNHPGVRQGLEVRVWRAYDDFVEELSERFPHEREGIKKFYGECWAVFNALNSLELKSLEEPRYLLGGIRLLNLLFVVQVGPSILPAWHLQRVHAAYHH